MLRKPRSVRRTGGCKPLRRPLFLLVGTAVVAAWLYGSRQLGAEAVASGSRPAVAADSVAVCDTTAGRARYAGWAELPAEQELPGDYYYAYHLSPDRAVRNYSVCYSAARHCPVWTAAPMHPTYEGDAGRNARWTYDPDMPREVQPLLKTSYRDTYVRGHMVASNERQATVGENQQTFYFSNIAPQIQNGFNGGIWASLENLCDRMLCRDTLYVLTGAWFGEGATTCADKQGMEVAVPTHFYKVLIRSRSGRTGKSLWELRPDEIICAGWWLEHRHYGTKEKISAAYMKPVAEIEEQTGLRFFANVPAAPKTTCNPSDWGL